MCHACHMTCAYDNCERPTRSTGSEWCEGHYYQLRRGTPLRPLGEYRRGPRPCSIEGCEKIIPTGSVCSKHEKRIRVHADPHKVIPREEWNFPKGEDHHHWSGEDVSYTAVHQRLRNTRGRASEQTCPCGQPARQWSYTGPRAEGERLPYSADLSLYEARCVPCHKKSDMDAIRHA